MLARAIASFEERSHEVVVRNGGRVVKLIGDEVMFAADEPAAACGIALGLNERIADIPALPPLRIGLATGEALLRDGDYFGPVVNVAARAAAAVTPPRSSSQKK